MAQPKKEKAEQKAKPLTEQDFLNEYDALCKKYQRVLASEPVFWIRDDGSYSIKLRHYTVVKKS